jgi:hypothetical protein
VGAAEATAQLTGRTRHSANRTDAKHRGRKPTEIDFRGTIVATQPEPRSEHPEPKLRHTAGRSRQRGRAYNPLVPVQDRSARPKPNRQRPKALQRRKRRLRENLDWVKLELAASCEPPRHQRQCGTEAPNRAPAASTQEPMPSEEAHLRAAEADRTNEQDTTHPKTCDPRHEQQAARPRNPTPTEVVAWLPKSGSPEATEVAASGNRSCQTYRVSQRTLTNESATMGLAIRR